MFVSIHVFVIKFSVKHFGMKLFHGPESWKKCLSVFTGKQCMQIRRKEVQVEGKKLCWIFWVLSSSYFYQFNVMDQVWTYRCVSLRERSSEKYCWIISMIDRTQNKWCFSRRCPGDHALQYDWLHGVISTWHCMLLSSHTLRVGPCCGLSKKVTFQYWKIK